MAPTQAPTTSTEKQQRSSTQNEQPPDNNNSTDSTSSSSPVCLVLGMAGSGKTTLVDTLSAYLEDPEGEEEEEEEEGDEDDDDEDDEDDEDDDEDEEEDKVMESLSTLKLSEKNSGQQTSTTTTSSSSVEHETFVVNLDPAVHELPYEPNIDIRDTIDYKSVMKDYKLGPNGAIITSLNLYATRFDQVMNILERRHNDSNTKTEMMMTIIDTPGQIETFTWSASGQIITDSLAHSLPTVIVYVIDTPRAQSPMTFVSNMLYACSIMYKTRLPMVVAFNKVDTMENQKQEEMMEWMKDFDAFDRNLKDNEYIGNLARSMAMTLSQFYQTLQAVQVSAVTGHGLDTLVQAIHEATAVYYSDYKPLLEEKKRLRREEEENRRNNDLERFKRDAKDELGSSNNGMDPALQPWYATQAQEEEEEEAEEDDNEDGLNSANNRTGRTAPMSNLTPAQRERLRNMMTDASAEKDRRLRVANPSSSTNGEDEVDEEELQAYEEFRKYIEAVKGKKI